ncbi:MAG TPA: hypothetical protein VF805_11675 [Anaeromyxobacteraceae bacterium]
MRALAAALALSALAACDTQGRPPACPGEAVALLHFQGAPVDGGCPWISDGGISFTGTVAYGQAGQAYLCLDRPNASLLAGQRAGDHLIVTGSPVDVSLDACGCPLTLTEQLEGDVLRADGGASGFMGALSDSLVSTDGGTAGCERAGGAACGVPCVARWTVQGAR